MDTKIKTTFVLFLIFSTKVLLGQNKINEAKKYAFNKCISYNYQKIDGNFYNIYKDASGTQISIEGNFLEDEEFKNKLIDYTIEKTGLYYSLKNNLHFENGDKNTVFYNCLHFYESKELDNYVKKILGIRPKKKSIKK